MHPFHISQTKSIKNNKFTLKKPFIANRKTCFHFFQMLFPKQQMRLSTRDISRRHRQNSHFYLKIIIFDEREIVISYPRRKNPFQPTPGKNLRVKPLESSVDFAQGVPKPGGVNYYFLCNNLSSASTGQNSPLFPPLRGGLAED